MKEQKNRPVSKKSITYLYILSSMMILFSVFIGGWVEHNAILNSIYLIGALLYIVSYIIRPKEETIRLKRLNSMNILAGILLVVSALAKFGLLDRFGTNLWILFFTIGVIFMVYANFVIGFLIKHKK